MRLSEVKTGKGISLKHKVMRAAMQLMMDGGAPDIVKVLMYRHGYLGKPLGELFEKVMRGPSDLTVVQRELIATATSEANECPFCVNMHATTASLASQENGDALAFDVGVTELDKQVDTATKALMHFASKLAKQEDFGPKDIDQLREVGFSDSAIEDAIYIVFVFCMINRIANALDFDIPSNKGYQFSGNILLKKGYRI